MRNFIIAANWKMNHVDMLGFFGALEGFDIPQNVTAVVCAPFTMLSYAARDADKFGVKISVGAQDVSKHDAGAYTGEISAPMLKFYGVEYAIVGHSERRQYHFESDGIVRAKTLAALKHGLIPIVCVGETLEEREAGRALEVIERQTRAVMFALKTKDIKRVVIAYEPVWAIGTGKVASPQDAEEACAFIKTLAAVPVLYGGSMTPENAAELLACANIDGGLVGGASLDPMKYKKLIEIAGKSI